MREVLKSEPEAEPDYVEIVDAESFEPVTLLRRECLAVLAVRVGGVRLLDNMLIEERTGGGFEVTL
jgi:pantoate--beta-alanine ligase